MDISDAEKILGLKGAYTLEDVIKAHQEQLKLYQPDRFVKMPQDMQDLAAEQYKRINEAFDVVKRQLDAGAETAGAQQTGSQGSAQKPSSESQPYTPPQQSSADSQASSTPPKSSPKPQKPSRGKIAVSASTLKNIVIILVVLLAAFLVSTASSGSQTSTGPDTSESDVTVEETATEESAAEEAASEEPATKETASEEPTAEEAVEEEGTAVPSEELTVADGAAEGAVGKVVEEEGATALSENLTIADFGYYVDETDRTNVGVELRNDNPDYVLKTATVTLIFLDEDGNKVGDRELETVGCACYGEATYCGGKYYILDVATVEVHIEKDKTEWIKAADADYDQEFQLGEPYISTPEFDGLWTVKGPFKVDITNPNDVIYRDTWTCVVYRDADNHPIYIHDFETGRIAANGQRHITEEVEAPTQYDHITAHCSPIL